MMKNILGEDIYNIRYDSESSLNIYGKDEAKLNRKMGHSNIIKQKKGAKAPFSISN